MAKKRRGYIYVEVEESVRVDVENIINEIDDELLLDELKNRNLIKEHEENIPKEGIELRRMLCDICEVGYHSTIESILKILEEKLF